MALVTIGADITVETVVPLCHYFVAGYSDCANVAEAGFDACADCLDTNEASDYYKSAHGMRPRHMTLPVLLAWYRAERAAGWPLAKAADEAGW